MPELAEDAPLTADEILTFGPVVEAAVWHPMWLQEQRAPIAVAAGRPKFGQVFDKDGVGKAVVIRPCMSRGARIRGLPPIYTPQMLERHAGVFDGWPMFLDHAPAPVKEALAKRGRSVTELGGQLLTGTWRRGYTHPDDRQYGYQPGATVADIWARPLVREMVGENPNLLHTSINAWPTSGKPGSAPWRPGVKGMVIEGIRRQPQGSVDYVVRGGAGGRLLVAEGLEDEGAWPEAGEMGEADVRLVVSLAESLYASPQMPLPTKPSELQAYLQEHAPHLLPALGEGTGKITVTLSEADADEAALAKLIQGGMTMSEAWTQVKAGKNNGNDNGGGSVSEGETLTKADVEQMLRESQAGQPTVEEFEARLREQSQQMLTERESQRTLSEHAVALIESATGIPPKWKGDLKARYSMLPSGPPATLIVESSDLTDAEGKALTAAQVVEARATTDLEHVRDLLAEAVGKPRVKGEGAGRRDTGEDSGKKSAGEHHWRKAFAGMGLAESEDKAVGIFGQVEG